MKCEAAKRMDELGQTFARFNKNLEATISKMCTDIEETYGKTEADFIFTEAAKNPASEV